MTYDDGKIQTAGTGTGDIDLSQFDEDFGKAEIQDRNFEPVPDGKYQVNVEKVEITRAKSSGKPMLKWELKILAPKYQGRLLWHYNLILSPENISWLKTDLHICGLDLEKVSELPDRLVELLDVKIEVNKRTKGENENVYFDRKIEESDALNQNSKTEEDTSLPF